MNDVTRQVFLTRPVVQMFCGHLQQLFEDQPFNHGFEVKWKRWAKHLREPDNLARRMGLVELSEKTIRVGARDRIVRIVDLRFASVKDAYETYYWPTNSQVAVTDDPAGGGADDDSEVATSTKVVAFDLESNGRRLAQLRNSLIEALEDTNEEKTFIAAMKILDWGQVYKGSVGWLIEKFENNELVSVINDATKALEGDQLSAITPFGTSWRMDSGLTKVYSLASEKSIIYDDRVAAALGLMVIHFLDTYPQQQFDDQGRVRVPEDLRFMVSTITSRNPSLRSRGLSFPRKEGGALHARSNLMANWILGRVASQIPTLWDKSDLTAKLRAMESALFMLGYRVK